MSAFRYLLQRHWHDKRPLLGFVMLNPSTADETRDDPTIRRCVGFAAREGYGGILVANLAPLRATNPRTLWEAPECGSSHPEQRQALGRVADLDAVVCAWGAHGRRFPGLVAATLGALREGRCRLLSIGPPLSDGTPRHPLYLKGDTAFHPWG